jgi:hypothetical protein
MMRTTARRIAAAALRDVAHAAKSAAASIVGTREPGPCAQFEARHIDAGDAAPKTADDLGVGYRSMPREVAEQIASAVRQAGGTAAYWLVSADSDGIRIDLMPNSESPGAHKALAWAWMRGPDARALARALDAAADLDSLYWGQE